MSDPGKYRTAPLQGWQRTNVVAAANCLREQLARAPGDPKLLAAYEGLLDLLDPSRLTQMREGLAEVRAKLQAGGGLGAARAAQAVMQVTKEV